MIFMGLGNAGTRILWNHYEKGSWNDKGHHKFVFGDADSNNSVLHHLRSKGLLDTKSRDGHIKELKLDRYWRGGCGVYHIIGQLVGKKAAQTQLVRELDLPQQDGVSLIFSAGGGTGGGVASYFVLNNSLGKMVRAYAVLPEVEHTQADQGQDLIIKGPDDFQCTSAGRFLCSFANGVMHRDPPLEVDVVLLSNSALAAATGLGYREAVTRLNGYLSRVLTLMPDTNVFPPNQRVLMVGMGAVGKAGDMSPERIAAGLVKSCLSKINLSHPVPTGLSVTPTQSLVDFEGIIDYLLGENDKHRSEGHFEYIRAAMSKCKAIRCFTYCRKAGNAVSRNALATSVLEKLRRVFGAYCDIALPEVTQWGGPAEVFKLGEREDCDYVALILIDQMMIEEVHRLMTYFIESSFAWKAATDVESVAARMRDIIQEPANCNKADNMPVQLCDDVFHMLTTSAPAEDGSHKPFLERDEKECYPPHFWGNIEDIRFKVLQSLDEDMGSYNNMLVDSKVVAGGIAYLAQQVWRYQGLVDEPGRPQSQYGRRGK